jgi:hypothetical protein
VSGDRGMDTRGTGDSRRAGTRRDGVGVWSADQGMGGDVGG